MNDTVHIAGAVIIDVTFRAFQTFLTGNDDGLPFSAITGSYALASSRTPVKASMIRPFLRNRMKVGNAIRMKKPATDAQTMLNFSW